MINQKKGRSLFDEWGSFRSIKRENLFIAEDTIKKSNRKWFKLKGTKVKGIRVPITLF